jgi:hypothetical protein
MHRLLQRPQRLPGIALFEVATLEQVIPDSHALLITGVATSHLRLSPLRPASFGPQCSGPSRSRWW